MMIQIQHNDKDKVNYEVVNGRGRVTFTFTPESPSDEITIYHSGEWEDHYLSHIMLNLGSESLPYVENTSTETLLQGMFNNLSEFSLDFRDYKEEIKGELTANQVRYNNLKRTVDGNSNEIFRVDQSITGRIETATQSIRETASLYERVIGRTEDDVKDRIARIVMTDSLFRSEVVNSDLKTRASQGLGTDDPTFLKGLNGLTPYNNLNNGRVSVGLFTYPTTPEGVIQYKPPSGNSKVVVVQSFGEARPNRGGVAKITAGRHNGEFVVRFVAKLPKGYTFEIHHNYLGYLSETRWISDNAGTGQWETYEYYVKCGISGTVESFGYTSVRSIDGKVEPLEWYLSSYDVIDLGQPLSTQVTQLADSWIMRLKSGEDIKAEINASTDGLRLAGKTIDLDGDVRMNNAFARKVVVEQMQARDVTAFMGKFGRIVANNMDANAITVNRAEFVRSGWNAINSRISIDGKGVKAKHKDGSITTLGPDGLFHQRGGTNYRTHFFTHVQTVGGVQHTQHDESAVVPGLVKGLRWVTLPAVFRGLPFKAHVSVADINNIQNEPNYYLIRFATLVRHDRINYNTAEVPIYGSAIARHRTTGRLKSFPITVQLVVTV